MKFRTRIREAAREPVNFAGEWVISSWGCGISCATLVAVNVRTGRVVWPEFQALGGQDSSFDNLNRIESLAPGDTVWDTEVREAPS